MVRADEDSIKGGEEMRCLMYSGCLAQIGAWHRSLALISAFGTDPVHVIHRDPS